MREKGGSGYGEAGWKLESVELVILTMPEDSLVSVSLAEVSCPTATVPVGAFGPEKVTGSAKVLLRLIMMMLRLFPPSLKGKTWSS